MADPAVTEINLDSAIAAAERCGRYEALVYLIRDIIGQEASNVACIERIRASWESIIDDACPRWGATYP